LLIRRFADRIIRKGLIAMKLVAPDYYPQFRCIADRCRHSCCIGWEIDIDEDTRAFYETVEGDFGRELAANIEDGETPHFRLGQNERCPFLDERNLCRIITNLGEDALCGICADHPRFRSFFDSRTEIGLGLCCEAAAELILGQSRPVTLVTLEDDGSGEFSENEEGFFAMREDIFRTLQARSMSVDDRIEAVLSRHGAALPSKSPAGWAEIYRSLERLDPAWDGMLNRLSACVEMGSCLSETVQEQLLVYFVFRHLSESLYDGMLRQRIAFAVLSTRMIDAICTATGESACEIARMYSSEIEYSDENIALLLDILAASEDRR